MSTFTIQPSVVDPDSLVAWKNAWMELWKKEAIAPTVIRLRPSSEWVIEESNVPSCPYHYDYCILDKSIKKLQNLNH